MSYLLLSWIKFSCSTQIVNNGSNFYGDTYYKYKNQIIKCYDNKDCNIICSAQLSCWNTTIDCPLNASCNIECISDDNEWSFTTMTINWIPGNSNMLACVTNNDTMTGCYRVPYPPSINDITPYTIHCDTERQCSGILVTCPNDAECNIICDYDYSCENAVIQCPSTAICNLQCIGYESCIGTMILWSKNPALANLTCPEGGSQCNLIQSPSILYAPNDYQSYTFECYQYKQCASKIIKCPINADCFVRCIHNVACAGITVYCPLNGDCNIICSGNVSCYYSTFYGPHNSKFEILCDAGSACWYLSIYAEKSSLFQLIYKSDEDKEDIATIMGISIWFPAKAQIIGKYDFVKTDRYEIAQFYAINGWLDLNISLKTDQYD